MDGEGAGTERAAPKRKLGLIFATSLERTAVLRPCAFRPNLTLGATSSWDICPLVPQPQLDLRAGRQQKKDFEGGVATEATISRAGLLVPLKAQTPFGNIYQGLPPHTCNRASLLLAHLPSEPGALRGIEHKAHVWMEKGQGQSGQPRNENLA